MSTPSLSLKEQLEAVKGAELEGTLLRHLSNVLTKLLLDDPTNAYDLLEDYSHHVRKTKYNHTIHPSAKEDTAARIRESYDQVQSDFTANKKLLDPLLEGDDDNLVPIGPVGYVPNFIEEAKWFEWAGIGFGEEESQRIFRSLAVLSNTKKEKNLKNVRLWGKILCSEQDYYIAEAQADFEDYGELPPDIEPLGGEEPGVNQLNYYVTSDRKKGATTITNLCLVVVKNDWVELPPVSPQQVQIARQIKYMFSGDLNRKVITNPHFESNTKPSSASAYSVGTEKELLKCQIVRISHTCSVQPKGLKIVDLEADPNGRALTDPDPDTFVFPEFLTLSSLENWVHSKQNILLEGKLKHTVPDAQEGEEQEDVEKRVQAKDPFEPLMKALATDKAPSGYKNAWILRTHGDVSDYAVAQKTSAKQNYGYISIKNLFWPGAVTAFHNKKWQSLYIGSGFKQADNIYFPAEPELILEERPEPICQTEPIPTEKLPEADEQAENNEQDDD